jgi:hypothetical protein
MRGRAGLAVRSERASVDEQLGVELPGAPGLEHASYRGVVDAQECRHGAQVGSECDDRADVEVPVGPPVEPAADAGGQRVIHRRMTEGALDADGP